MSRMQTPTRLVSILPAAPARARRGSLAVLVLTVAEYGIGMYVNLYVTIPGPATATAWHRYQQRPRGSGGERYVHGDGIPAMGAQMAPL